MTLLETSRSDGWAPPSTPSVPGPLPAGPSSPVPSMPADAPMLPAGPRLPPSDVRPKPSTPSSLFVVPAPVQLIPQAPRNQPNRGAGFRWIASRICVVALVALLLGGNWLFRNRHAEDAAASYPNVWDVRVKDLVTFVEQNRGLAFEHPVRVDFFSEADFVALFEPGEQPTDAATQADADKYASTLDAAGLTSGVDEGDTSSRVAQTASLGFYSFDTDSIFVRGEDLTPAVKAVLVHELTHALQSQHFEINPGGIDDLEIRSVVEADAMRIEDMYSSTLDQGLRAQADADNSGDGSGDAALEEIPWALVQQTFAPYVLGPLFLTYIADHGGNAAVNKVFARFPTEEELLTPSLYGAGAADQPVTAVVPAGAEVIEAARTWPMFDALVMLDAWLPWTQARTPFDAWAGGSYASYEKAGADGPVCFTAVAAFDTEADAAGFAAAVTAWAAASGSTAVPVVSTLQVSFEACDRGSAASVPPKPPFSTAESVYLEHLLLDSSPESTPSTAAELCTARTMVDDPALVPIFMTNDELTSEQDDIVTLEVAVAKSACGVLPT